jgi:hypothetical protein
MNDEKILNNENEIDKMKSIYNYLNNQLVLRFSERSIQLAAH